MRIVIQRVKKAKVEVENKIVASIEKGLLIFVGIEEKDGEDDISWLTNKTINLRIFADENGKMNLSLKEIQGEILLVSQFTLHAKTKKGHRPSFIKAAKPEIAIPIYEKLIKKFEELLEKKIKSGIFGAYMNVSIENDGPVTIIIDSKNKE